MANGVKKNSRISKITITFCVFFFLFLMLAFFISQKAVSLQEEYISLMSFSSDKRKELKSLENEIQELALQKENYETIDVQLNEVKKHYFEEIKKLEDAILSGKSDVKIAYLTFDDGPYYLTNKYLDVLEKYDVKGTFFTIGTGKEVCYDDTSKKCYPVYKKIIEQGHTIANHTYSHAINYGLYKSVNSFWQQVEKQEKLIEEQTGVITNIVRFPGGSVTSGTLKEGIVKKLKENGYGWVDWTAQDGDGGNIKSKEEAWNIFKNSIDSDIEVVLLHDYSYITLEILPNIIEYLQDNGYILLPLFYESNMINK